MHAVPVKGIVRSLLLTLAGLVLFGGALLVPARSDAQSGLDDQQLAWAERLLAARDRLVTHSSYVEVIQAEQQQRIALHLGGRAQATVTTTQLDRLSSIVRSGDDLNIHAFVNVTVDERQQPGASRAQPYTIAAEIRRVGGLLYVRAGYESAGPGVPTLPRGWVLIDDLTIFEGLRSLQLGDLGAPGWPVADVDLVRRTAADVTHQALTTREGLPVETITLTFGRDGVAAILRESPAAAGNPALAGLLADALEPDSRIVLRATFSQSGDPLLLETETVYRARGLDAREIDPGAFAAGVTLDIDLTTTRGEAYSEFDEPLIPVGPPLN